MSSSIIQNFLNSTSTSGVSRRGFIAGSAMLAGLGLALGTVRTSWADSAKAEDAKADGEKAAEGEAGSDEAAEAQTFDPADPQTIYVPASWVKQVVDGEVAPEGGVVILEVAWGEEADDKNYQEGHVPGAVHMNTDYIEAEEYWNFRTPEEIEQVCAKYGITKDTTVICYANKGTNSADDRVALVMLWAGVDNVKCLDGGMAAWTEAGYEVETESNAPVATEEPFGVEIPARPELVISIEETKDRLANDPNFKLVSIRSYDEFCGVTSGYSYIDVAGEPKGAIWGHDTDDGTYCNEDGTTKGIDAIKEVLAESGKELDEDTAFYCGTGWRAAIPVLICYQYGLSTMLYDGGWFQWQLDPENEVQVGDPATGDVVYTTVGELETGKAAK